MIKERIVCPNCGASYRVTVKMLQQAGQEARCAVCKEVFTINVQDIEFSPDNPEFSPENVIRQLRASEPRENPESEQEKSETAAAQPEGPQQAEGAKKAPSFSVTPTQKMPPAAPRVPAAEPPDSKQRELPAVAAGKAAPTDESAHHRILSAEAAEARRDKQPVALWVAGSVVLALVLLSQTAWLMRDNPFVYRNILAACSIVGCKPPELRNPKAISIADRLFTAVGDEPGTYQLRLNIRNHAPYPQPLPTIELSLLDSNGVVQARNRFEVDQYLAEQDDRILQPNQDTAVAFTVHSPAADTTGFMLDFL